VVLVAAVLVTTAGCGGDSSEGNADVTGPSVSLGPEAAAALDAGVVSYRAYVLEQAGRTRAATAVFTDAVRAGDLEAARSAYAPSRVGWERIEPVAGLVEELDGRLDARVDDFAGVDDPEFTGWHRLEHLLFARGTTEDGAPFADQLDADLATLERELAEADLTALDMATGATELVEEVSRGKITGEEDRYAHTDLWDFDANIDGSKKLFELLTPPLQAKDPALTRSIAEGFAEVDKSLAEYAEGSGFKSFTAVSADDKTRMKAELAGLSENLAKIPGVLGLKTSG